jgi:Peptidase family M1 domain
MLHRIALILLLLCAGTLRADARPPFQPLRQAAPSEVASYSMEVRLDPAAKTVAGSERITYRNPSQDTLKEIWLRLYLKAFSRPDTIWMRESGGGSRGFDVDASRLGDITVSALSLAGGVDLLASATLTDTLMHVPLPQPLPPGQSIELDARWTSKLPRVFARTGYGGRDDTFFMVGQWYPKMAVYDRGRWDTEPWHANAEFFNDFGNYDVSITLPQAYVVAGAGLPAGEANAGDSQKTLRYTSTDVTDFAFAASPDFLTRSAQAGVAEVVLYYLPEHASSVAEYIDASVGALQAYSDWYGAYPHPRLTVVDVPDNAGGAGGMEYPTLVTGGTVGAPPGAGFVALVTAHEIGHQWWPMQTATNEAREPWLDEGLTEYSGMRYMLESGRRLGFGGIRFSASTLDRSEYAAAVDQPADLPSWEYQGAGYGGAVYGKTAVGLLTLENVVGTARFRRAMAAYLAAYRYKHPTAADFRGSIERSLGGDLRWFFDDYIAGDGVIDYAAGAITNGPAGSSATVTRKGTIRVPVEVAVTLASGAQQTMQWDGQDSSTSFSFPAGDPIARVEIDPAHKLAAELNVLDNGASATPEVGPALTLGGRLLFLFQMLTQHAGMFG